MTAFEFVFSLFGLLLGFALVEVLSGLVRATREWSGFAPRFYLTSALGLFVSLDLITYWSALFASRDHLPANTLALYVGFVITGVYYWAASMIFPDPTEPQANLDDHYFAVRRKVVGAVLFCNVAMFAAVTIAWGRMPPLGGRLEIAAFAALFISLMLAKSKMANAILLTVIILAYLVSAVLRST